MILQKKGCPTETTAEAPQPQKNYLTDRVTDMRNFVNIPMQLKVISNWVVWKYGTTPNGNGKFPKVPYNPATKLHASVSNFSTWGTFEQAENTFLQGGFDGIGLVLCKGSGVFCIDLDNSYCNNELSELARKFMRLYPTWSEISISFNGIHIWGTTARNFEPVRNKLSTQDGDIEIYTNSRFIAVTGNVIGDELDVNYFENKEFDWCGSAVATPRNTQGVCAEIHSNDCKTSREERRFADSLFEKNPNFKLLWQGDFSSVNGDLSKVDFIVVCELNKSIYKVFKNFEDRYKLIRRLMLSNKFLKRDKWFTSRPNFHDYLHMTIHSAMTQNVNYGGK